MSVSLRRRLRLARKRRIRVKVQKNQDKPRLTVFKSTKHIYAQIVDDKNRQTLVSESTLSPGFRETGKYGGNTQAAAWVGRSLAEKAAQKEIKEVCYDRNGFAYAGRIKALADAVREKGIKV